MTVPPCLGINHIKQAGVPVLLFFSTIKHVASLMILSIAIFSGYALATNVINSGSICGDVRGCNINSLSIASKRLENSDVRNNEYLIQTWLGVVFVVASGMYFPFMSYRLRTLEIECERLKSVSDFSIMV